MLNPFYLTTIDSRSIHFIWLLLIHVVSILSMTDSRSIHFIWRFLIRVVSIHRLDKCQHPNYTPCTNNELLFVNIFMVSKCGIHFLTLFSAVLCCVHQSQLNVQGHYGFGFSGRLVFSKGVQIIGSSELCMYFLLWTVVAQSVWRLG